MRALIALFLLAPSVAIAQGDNAAPPPPPEPEPEPEPADDSALSPAAIAAALRRLEHQQESTRRRVDDLAPATRLLSAYVDAGFFAVGGDGSGIRSDLAHVRFPEYDGIVPSEWVFMGDPLSTAVNARGEPADTGNSRAISDDLVDSRGNPAFIANTVGLAVARELNDHFSLAAHVEILPRGRDTRLAVETALVDYQPWPERDLIVSAGKIDSVLGLEYRTQDAPDRLTVTPSLLCRYTCGRPVGVQARYFGDRIGGALSIASGDTFQSGFERDDRLVASALPTLSARVTVRGALGPGRIGVGASGAVGPQDRQSDDGVVQWHYGLDLAIRDFHDLDVQLEWMQGRLPGATAMMDRAPCGVTECLRYHGGYLLVGYHLSQRLVPYARADWRDATHAHGAAFVYISNTARVTAGINVMLGRGIMAKAEYIYNRELGDIPQFPNDVFTTSVVVASE